MAAKFEAGSGTRAPGTLGDGREPNSDGDAAAQRLTAADTIPPMPLKDLLSAGGANIFVLSTDTELTATVQRAGGEHFPVFAVGSWQELELAIDAERCGIALLDADLLGAALTARIVALERYSQRLVVLVAADRTTAQALMDLLSERKIHRLLIKPPALGITRLLVESAVNRCLQLRELAKTAGGAVDSSPPSVSARPRRRVLAWIIATAGAALLVGVGTVVGVSSWWRSPSPETGETPVTQVPEPAPAESQPTAPPQRFADLLARAEQAVGEGRLATPTGDNALDYYLVILATDPMEPTARAQLARVVDALFAQAEEALLADEHEAVAAALAHVRRAEPTSSRLAFLDEQLDRARAAATLVAATRAAALAPQPTEPAPQPAKPATQPAVAGAADNELASLLTIGRARIEGGQSLEPSADSAREYLDRAAQLAPEDAEAAAFRGEFGGALVAAARLALERGEIATAATLTAQARGLGAAPEALALLDAELARTQAAGAAQRHPEWRTLATERLRSGALVTPAGDSALHYLEQLQSEAPELVGLAALWETFRAALVVRVQTALAARAWQVAEAELASLQRAPQSDAVAAPLRAQLEFGRLQQQYLADWAAASELTLLERVPLVYPQNALEREIEGWVDVEFVVDTTGRPRDLVVVGAEPTGRFEAAALAAIGQYRYAPFERNGRLFERRIRVRTRFTLE